MEHFPDLDLTFLGVVMEVEIEEGPVPIPSEAEGVQEPETTAADVPLSTRGIGERSLL